jgi:hypothetical protein
MDARYAELVAAADPAAVLEADVEDAATPPLLAAGLKAWIVERREGAQAYSVDPPPGPRPALPGVGHELARHALPSRGGPVGPRTERRTDR